METTDILKEILEELKEINKNINDLKDSETLNLTSINSNIDSAISRLGCIDASINCLR